MSWERGVVVRLSTDGRTLFVTSSSDTSILYSTPGKSVEVGDCIEFTAFRLEGSEGSMCRRRVDQFEKCDRFVDIEVTKDGCLLILEVLEIEEPTPTRPFPLLRTSFLERVLDNGDYPVTHRETVHSLRQKGLKVVCKRIVDHASNETRWFAIGLKKRSDRFEEKRLDAVSPRNSDSIPYVGKNRTRLKGLVCTSGAYRDGKDEIYIWIPFQDRPDIFFPPNLRKNRDRWEFYGRWLDFTVGEWPRLDEESDYRFIEDELPTRSNEGRCEICVKCWYDPSSYRDSRDPLLESDACGLIADANSVLDRYDKKNTRFSANLWVFSQLYEKNRKIRWVLSGNQDYWNFENVSRGRFDDEREYERSSKRYDDEYERSYREPVDSNRRLEFNQKEYLERKEESRTSRDYDRQGSSRYGVNDYEPNRRSFEKPQVSRFDQDDGSYRSESSRSGNRQDRVVEEMTALKVKQLELRKLEMQFDYMMKHKLPIAENFSKKMKDLRAVVEDLNFQDIKARSIVESSRSSNLANEDTRSETSSFKKRKEEARIEILEEELARYKKVVTLFRDMLSDEDVCNAMRSFDPKATDEIFQNIFQP